MANAAADKKLKKALEYPPRWDDVVDALAKGANPNTKAPDGQYVLAIACWYVQPDAVRELLARGANPNIAKGAPLWSAVSTVNRMHDVSEVVEMLVKAGADGTIKDDDGRTPIEAARQRKYRDLVALMTGKKRKGKAAIYPFVETTYFGSFVRGEAPHTSGVPDWGTVYKGKQFPGCGNPPVHLLTLDLRSIPEFPEPIRRLGKLAIVGHACECDEQDLYRFAIGRDGRLSNLDKNRSTCEPDDYEPSKKATPVKLVPATGGMSGGIVVGGQPRWAQAPAWPSCPKCRAKSFFVACLYQFDLPPGAEGRGNTLNVFVCGRCRTQCMVRQST